MSATKPKKEARVCIFCGEPGAATDEHIFPESWYPDDTPANVWRWQAPACYACNHDYYAPRERRVFPFLAMSVDPELPGAAGIAEKALRASSEFHGRSEKDRACRRRLQQLMRARQQIAPSNSVPEGADPLGHRHLAPTVLTTYVHEDDLLPVISKIARGFVYIDSGERVAATHSVKVFRELSLVPPVFRGMTANETAAVGSGLIVDIVRIEPYPPTCFMQIRIWGGAHVWYAAIIPQNVGS